MLTKSALKAIAPSANADILDGIVGHQAILDRYGITKSPLRLCHFLAQIAHESAHFRTTREYASGAAYEGRRDLGNVEPGDGRRIRGRGLIQLTGRSNYGRAARETGEPLLREPARLERFPLALEAAGLYWRWRNLNTFADRNDIRAITVKINGGLNGYADRRRYFHRANEVLGPSNPDGEQPTILRLGATGARVRHLQTHLSAAGADYRVTADGIFGPFTRDAVLRFQRDNDLAADGIAGPVTQAALKRVQTPVAGKAVAGATAAVAGVAASGFTDLVAEITRHPTAPVAIAAFATGAALGLSTHFLRDR